MSSETLTSLIRDFVVLENACFPLVSLHGKRDDLELSRVTLGKARKLRLLSF